MECTKLLLGEDRIPRSWYNLVSDLPKPPAPVLHPGTLQPVTPDDLLPLFPNAGLHRLRGRQAPQLRVPGRRDPDCARRAPGGPRLTGPGGA